MVNLAAREIQLPTYRVTVARGALDALGEIVFAAAPAHRYALISDTHVAPHYAERARRALGEVATDLFTIPAGETHKTRESWAELTDRMVAAECGRDTTVIALGGGVVGDLAGFVAATYMRGLSYVQVPTSLLAMIDASIGGKTGVDTPAGKNLVGAFHQPAAVVADPDVLRTLPPEHLRAGLAEAIKHGVIADERYFSSVVAFASTASLHQLDDAVVELVARSIEIKADLVRRDEREGGLRKTLNFGHTLGHAIERCTDYRMLHGEAIAIGMVLESRLAEHIRVAESGTADAVVDAVQRAGLPRAIPADVDAPAILRATRSDKKARAGKVEYALPRCIGTMAGGERGWAMPVPDDAVLRVLQHSTA